MGPLPCAVVGVGPPVAVLAGLSPTTGIEGDGMLRATLGPFAELGRTRRLVLFNRRPRLPRGMTMSQLAGEHADAIRQGFGAPIDVVGISSGGSIAQQLAADHPDVVDHLVLVSTACRLSDWTRWFQRRVAARIRAGASRQALAVMAAELVPPGRGQHLAGVAGWLLTPRVAKHPFDLDDMATTIEAEDTFDLAACDAPVKAPTVILAGREDRFYTTELFEETARLIPASELHLLDRRGNITVMNDRRLRRALACFLAR